LGDVKKKIAVAVPHGISEGDLSTHAQKFKDAEVDTVILLANPVKVALLLSEFEKLDFRPRLLGTEILADPLMFELAGEMWEGAIVATGVPDPKSDEPGVVQAREILAKYGSGESLGTFTLMGISWAQLLAEGLQQAGEDLTRVRLMYALENLTNSDNVLGVTYKFTPENHHGFDSVRLMRAEGGKYVYLTDWIRS
jgi:ABC-type branched-subunit amino acid transport system substrate-binding protein